MKDATLTAAIAAEVLRLPEVDRLYPPRRTLGTAVRAAAALVRDLGGAPALEQGGAVAVDVGLRPGTSAAEAGLACVAAVRRALPPERAGSPVRVRIVSVD